MSSSQVSAGNPRRDQIKDRKRIAETIAEEIQWRHKGWTIDKLLAHPYDAIKLAKAVLTRLGRKRDKEGINEICRAALSSRKRGDLKRS